MLHPNLRSTFLGGLSGFLFRPCCMVPAAMSFVGVGSAGAGAAIAAHRTPFLLASAALLGVSIYVNSRRDDGWVSKSVVVIASVLAFSVFARWPGVF